MQLSSNLSQLSVYSCPSSLQGAGLHVVVPSLQRCQTPTSHFSLLAATCTFGFRHYILKPRSAASLPSAISCANQNLESYWATRLNNPISYQ
eukprot:6453774-Amphidinium_carterae.1